MYIAIHMMIQDISLFPRSSPRGQKRYNQGRYIKDSNILLVIMMMVRRTEDIKSREIHQRFKHDAPGDYDDGDDGEEARGHRRIHIK